MSAALKDMFAPDHEDAVQRARPFTGDEGILAQELTAILTRRRKVLPPDVPLGTPSVPSDDTESGRLAKDYVDAHNVRPFGVAFSGGGIRSATFGLGVLQGLAQLGILKHVDYLSTVSGGGYIGAWLHGVIRRNGGKPDAAVATLCPNLNPAPGPPQEDPISFLRKFSNYLAPRPGAFSLDSWVMAVIWLRNVLLNQLLIVPVIFGLAVVAVFLGSAEHYVLFNMRNWEWQTVALQDWASGLVARALGRLAYDDWLTGVTTFGIIFTAIAVFGSGVLLARQILSAIVRQTFARTSADEPNDPRRSLTDSTTILWLWFAGCLLLGAAAPGAGVWDRFANVVLFVGIGALLFTFQNDGGFHACYRARNPKAKVSAGVHVLWMCALCTTVAYGLVFTVWYILPWTKAGAAEPWLRIAAGPSLMCACLLSGGVLLTGLMGADYPDAAREWMARTASGIALRCLAWCTFFLVTIFGPFALVWLTRHYGKTAATAIAGWVATTGAGVWAGRSAKTGGVEQASGAVRDSMGDKMLGWLVALAPQVFIAGYVLAIATFVHVAFRETMPEPQPRGFADGYFTVLAGEGPEEADLAGTGGFPLGQEDRDRADAFFHVRWEWVFLLLGGCTAVGVVANRRININEFSMHHFYKNRLVRCYLGASNNRQRKPDGFTGFDPNDDVLLDELRPDSREPYYGPYAIINAALNLNAGSELAQQERKATSFVFTPRYCGFAPSKAQEVAEDPGFDPNGYRETAHYSNPSGPHLGTAMAISGAAANPNAGYHTSGPMAFLLTIFNARLGWWLANPRHQASAELAGPLFSLKYLFTELTGRTTATTKFVNLSDGGHFDNLGLYELVRRRCRYIVIADAEQDEAMTFSGLGGAIRKCRADFGVEIDLSPDPIRLNAKGVSSAHCVVGSISYPEMESGLAAPFCNDEAAPNGGGRARGWVLYIKSSITGDEPADILEYRSANPAFPQQSTTDQFFSESQFESYRRLGLHIARTAFDGVWFDRSAAPGPELLRTFQTLARNWYPAPEANVDSGTRLTERYTALMRRMGEVTVLTPLTPQILGTPGVRDVELNETQRVFIVELLQLMEDVFTTFRLELKANRANPRIGGWMRVFERWSQSDALRKVWPLVRNDYNPLFQQFLGDSKDDSHARPTDLPPRP